MEKFSYSKLEIFETCGWHYKLQYVDKHFVDTSSVATDFGTLVHFVEETMGKDIKNNNNDPLFLMDYQKYSNIFIDGYHTEEENIKGIKELQELYKDDWFKKDKAGFTYADKASNYLSTGIYRLRDYMTENPDLEIIGLEQEFNLEYGEFLFHGFIDRIFKNKDTGEILIEDIKTWDKPKDIKDLRTPLQFVFYSLAVQELYPNTSIVCAYELPLIGMKQVAGTVGFIGRGTTKINKLLEEISKEQFEPNPTPLCHWCPFCKTFPNQPEEAKNLCPYFSHWTRENPTFEKEFEWMGLDNHQAILEAFIKKNAEEKSVERKEYITISKPIELKENTSRRFILRR